MIFSRSNTELPGPLNLCNTVIERQSESRFLGVIVDENLTWARHIQTVQSKMSRYIGIMYKLKNLLPLKARILIYHSFVQSHVNYCLLVWGFAAKTHIESLFSKQKKGIRAVVPGFINYKYRDGVLPGHTKKYFNEYNILTIHGIIVSNALNFIHRARHFPCSIPESIRNTIAEDSPLPGDNHVTCGNWISKYENNIYLKSVFYKGPLIAVKPHLAELVTPASLISAKVFKNNVKRHMLTIQSIGDADTWESENFPLFHIPGLRKSSRLNRTECTLYSLERPPLL